MSEYSFILKLILLKMFPISKLETTAKMWILSRTALYSKKWYFASLYPSVQTFVAKEMTV